VLLDDEVVEDIKEETVNEKTEEVAEEQVEEILDERDLKIKELEEMLKNLNNEIGSIKKAAADVVNRNKQLEVDKKYGSFDLVRNLLVPISYFEGALKFKSTDENFNNFLKGFEMIYNSLLDQLYSAGLKMIDTKVNDEFDPKIHEVVDLVQTDDVEENKIVEVRSKGYYFKDRVLKPAQVNVSQKVELSKSEENKETVYEEMVN
jgi:molecular chaperone GrpE